MGLAVNFLLCVLPIALSNQVLYYLPQYLPYYQQSNGVRYLQQPQTAPLPYIRTVPQLYQGQGSTTQPLDSFFGNRKHEYIPDVSYNGNCGDATAEWEDHDSGVTATLRLKVPPTTTTTTAGFASPYYSVPSRTPTVELVWTRPVAHLSVFDAAVDRTEGANFRVSPQPYTVASTVGQEAEVRVSFKAEFAQDSPRPGLQGVLVNGVYTACQPGAASTDDQDDTNEVGAASVGLGNGDSVRLAPHVAWPRKVMGLYVLLADDDEEGYDSNAEWEPELYEWQQEGSNVLFFTFIHPDTMEVPPSFQKLAASRGTGKPGSVPSNTVIMFAIGGYAYSLKPNPWHWLTSKDAAERMAEKVAEWPEKYGCDGIDLDLEEGAGAKRDAGPNMVHFIRRLKELKPNIIVSQPTYGYPQVQAEIDVINASWDAKGNSNGLADSIGLMVYEGTQALQYVKNYANGSGQWEGFPVKVNAPKNTILLGAKGSSSSSTIAKLAQASLDDDLLGIMVWYASVKNGFDYAASWDASTKEDSKKGYIQAMKTFNAAMGK